MANRVVVIQLQAIQKLISIRCSPSWPSHWASFLRGLNESQSEKNIDEVQENRKSLLA